MKRYMRVLAAIAISVAMVGGAYAADIKPMVSVTGSVGGLCKAGTAGVMSFSIPDPSVPGPITATVTDATVFCTKDTPFTVTAASLNNGAPEASCAAGGITGTLIDGINTMDYTFTCGSAAGTGQGFGGGNDQSLGLAGSIASSAYANAPARALYADTVTLTITY
jgi:spore coat protein U-like protein